MCTVMLRGSVHNLDIGRLPNTDSGLFLYLGVVKSLHTIHVITVRPESPSSYRVSVLISHKPTQGFFNFTRSLYAFLLEKDCS